MAHAVPPYELSAVGIYSSWSSWRARLLGSVGLRVKLNQEISLYARVGRGAWKTWLIVHEAGDSDLHPVSVSCISRTRVQRATSQSRKCTAWCV